MKAKQLRELIIRPLLEDLAYSGLIKYSPAAEDLLIATACAESQCGHYIRQETNDGYGPAMGVYQMEPATAHDIYRSWIKYRPSLYFYYDKFSGNLYCMEYATFMARVHYYRVSEALPAHNPNIDVYLTSLGEYWKKYYNTEKGAGTIAGFIKKCEKYGDFL